MSVSLDQNGSRKEYEKLSHYKDLQAKIWKLSTTVISIIIGTLRIIKKNAAQKTIKELPAKSNLRELLKITLMGIHSKRAQKYPCYY